MGRPWSHLMPSPPQLFAFLGFLTSALWINAAATEVVNILRSLGVVFQLSNTVLGLTLLAWGNSIGGDSGMVDLWGGTVTAWVSSTLARAVAKSALSMCQVPTVIIDPRVLDVSTGV